MIKKLIIAAMLVTISSSANEWDINKNDDFCTSYSKTAHSIMQARQNGASIIKVMKIMTLDIDKNLVKQAYKQPKYSGSEYINKTSVEFANKSYLMCIEVIENKKDKK